MGLAAPRLRRAARAWVLVPLGRADEGRRGRLLRTSHRTDTGVAACLCTACRQCGCASRVCKLSCACEKAGTVWQRGRLCVRKGPARARGGGWAPFSPAQWGYAGLSRTTDGRAAACPCPAAGWRLSAHHPAADWGRGLGAKAPTRRRAAGGSGRRRRWRGPRAPASRTVCQAKGARRASQGDGHKSTKRGAEEVWWWLGAASPACCVVRAAQGGGARVRAVARCGGYGHVTTQHADGGRVGWLAARRSSAFKRADDSPRVRPRPRPAGGRAGGGGAPQLMIERWGEHLVRPRATGRASTAG